MDKEPGAFRTISEVAEDLDLPQHVLRFWETRFSQIKPLKRGGGRRYYRPDDVDLLRGIRHLLYGEGYTIRGVQRILRDEGVRFVQTVWQVPEAPPAGREHAPSRGAGDRDFDARELTAPDIAAKKLFAAQDLDADPPEDGEMALPPRCPAEPPSSEPPLPETGPPRRPATEPAGRTGLLGLLPKLGRESEPPLPPRVVEVPIPAARSEPPPLARPPQEGARPLGEVPALRPAPRLSATEPEKTLGAGVASTPLSRENARRLQAVLYELQECRRILDAALSAGRKE